MGAKSDKWSSRLWAGLLYVLGFSSLVSLVACYGVPETSYKIVLKGKVTNSDGEALPGMRVIVSKDDPYDRSTKTSYSRDFYGYYFRDTVYSNQKGEYWFVRERHSGDPNPLTLTAEEPGSGPGSYRPNTQTVEFFGSDYKNIGDLTRRAAKTVDIILESEE